MTEQATVTTKMITTFSSFLAKINFTGTFISFWNDCWKLLVGTCTRFGSMTSTKMMNDLFNSFSVLYIRTNPIIMCISILFTIIIMVIILVQYKIKLPLNKERLGVEGGSGVTKISKTNQIHDDINDESMTSISSSSSCPFSSSSSSSSVVAMNDVSKRPTKLKKERVCPYSSETKFITFDLEQHNNKSIHEIDPKELTPLDLYVDWLDPNCIQEYGKKPLAARWLNAGISGQDTPGILRAGLKKLYNWNHFLVEETTNHMTIELQMKAAALDDPIRRSEVFVYEPESLPAQQEVLDLFLRYLPKRYPHLYHYDTIANTIHVVPIDRTFIIHEWNPFELCERIVQEDLVLMRPPTNTLDDITGEEQEQSKQQQQFVMSAAAVVFSFSQLREKLGQPMSFLHAPVPGYDAYIRKTLDLMFHKLLKVNHPMWRNNWGISPGSHIGGPVYGTKEYMDARSMSKNGDDDNNNNNTTTTTVSIDDIKNSKYVIVEYETIQRLPQTNYLLFTIKTMSDPICALEHVPDAAKCLAASIRGMSRDMRKYKGIENDTICEVFLSYLDEIALKATPTPTETTTS